MKQDTKGAAIEAWDARQSERKYVGLDVHQATIAVAVAGEGRGEVRSYGTSKHASEAVAKLVKRLGPAERLACCDEAGPCGYGLERHLTGLGATGTWTSSAGLRPANIRRIDRRSCRGSWSARGGLHAAALSPHASLLPLDTVIP